MMNVIHLTVALELMALVFGVALLIYIKNQTKIKTAWASFVAWFVIVASIISILCSIYTSVMFWNKGYYKMYHHKMMERYEHMNKEGQ